MSCPYRKFIMNKNLIAELKSEIVETGRLLWDKDLASGLNGNISARVDDQTILLTATQTCLGRLAPADLLLLKLDGTLLEEGKVSTEKLLHTEIYKNFPEITAVVHTHTNYTNGYFAVHDSLVPSTFESRFYLGDIKAIEQHTPSVTDARPVMEAFKQNNIVVLKNHGTVAMGKSLFDCFLLIQVLEDAVKVDVISRLYKGSQNAKTATANSDGEKLGSIAAKKYQLFSKEQIDEIVRLVNADFQLKELGEKTNMTMDLAVKLNETGQIYSFHFERGSIIRIGNDETAEFLISASENIWRAVFNREIDPFVATTQKKMNLRGDFARISRWYAPCNRIFQLWQQVPVE